MDTWQADRFDRHRRRTYLLRAKLGQMLDLLVTVAERDPGSAQVAQGLASVRFLWQRLEQEAAWLEAHPEPAVVIPPRYRTIDS